MKYLAGIAVLVFGLTISSQAKMFKWEAPATNADGSPLTDFASYRMACGRSAGGPYDMFLETVDPEAEVCRVIPKKDGDFYCVVYAVDTSGNVSNPSNEINITEDCLPASGCTDLRVE